MKIRSLAATVAGLALFSSCAQANWVCNVSNENAQQFTYSAPLEEEAEKIASSICEVNGINKNSCNPDCFDTGSNTSRWHCAITKNSESWSFTMLNKEKAMNLAKLACKRHNINEKDCKPSCSIE